MQMSGIQPNKNVIKYKGKLKKTRNMFPAEV